MRCTDRVEKGFDIAATEFTAVGLTEQVSASFFSRKRHTIGAHRREGVEHIDNANDLREERKVIAAQAKRVPAAIESLVMAQHNRTNTPQ